MFEVSTLMRATETRKARFVNAVASKVGTLSGTYVASECGWRCSNLALETSADGDLSVEVLNVAAYDVLFSDIGPALMLLVLVAHILSVAVTISLR